MKAKELLLNNSINFVVFFFILTCFYHQGCRANLEDFIIIDSCGKASFVIDAGKTPVDRDLVDEIERFFRSGNPLPAINNLIVSNYRFTPNTLQAMVNIFQHHPLLTTFSFAGSDIGSIGIGAIIGALRITPRIIGFNLSNNNLQPDDAIQIATILEMPDTALEHIELRGNDLNSAGAVAIAESLLINNKLVSLDISANNMRDGISAITHALGINRTLSHIDVGVNDINISGAVEIANMLRTNTILKTLGISWNRIGNDGIAAIADALEKNSTLASIDASGNKIDVFGIIHLANALRKNNSLKNLILDYNDISDNGVGELCRVLSINNVLAGISLVDNNITLKGIQAIANLLQSNDTLTSINLELNNIGDDGAKEIARALKTNESLLSINLSYNGIVGDGIMHLLNALSNNNTLTSLNFLGNRINSNNVIRAIASTLLTNTTLTNIMFNEFIVEDNGSLMIADQEIIEIIRLCLRRNKMLAEQKDRDEITIIAREINSRANRAKLSLLGDFNFSTNESLARLNVSMELSSLSSLTNQDVQYFSNAQNNLSGME